MKHKPSKGELLGQVVQRVGVFLLAAYVYMLHACVGSSSPLECPAGTYNVAKGTLPLLNWRT